MKSVLLNIAASSNKGKQTRRHLNELVQLAYIEFVKRIGKEKEFMKVIGDSEHFKQPYDQDDDYISKTTLKEESELAQKLGIELAALSKTQLEKVGLDEPLWDAIAHLKTIKPKTEAYRRQLQRIGKLMRYEDADEIKAGMKRALNKNNEAAAKAQVFEKLKEKLLLGGDIEVQALIELHPTLERQKLRQLIRQANKERKSEKEEKSAVELIKYLRSVMEE